MLVGGLLRPLTVIRRHAVNVHVSLQPPQGLDYFASLYCSDIETLNKKDNDIGIYSDVHRCIHLSI